MTTAGLDDGSIGEGRGCSVVLGAIVATTLVVEVVASGQGASDVVRDGPVVDATCTVVCSIEISPVSDVDSTDIVVDGATDVPDATDVPVSIDVFAWPATFESDDEPREGDDDSTSRGSDEPALPRAVRVVAMLPHAANIANGASTKTDRRTNLPMRHTTSVARLMVPGQPAIR